MSTSKRNEAIRSTSPTPTHSSRRPGARPRKGNPEPANTAFQFDAFLSYSRSDEALAAALQPAIERFARPWNRPRTNRVFRDRVALGAGPDLRASIESALERSRWFVLLASPRSATSSWVRQEVSWWLTHRGPEQLLVVLVEGDMVWDEATGRLDADRWSAIPPELAALPAEPLWVDARWSAGASIIERDDLRLVENVADLVSAIRGVDKDTLHGTAVREARRTRRLTRGAIVTLSSLLVISLLAGGVAVLQRGRALEEARISLGRQLAALAESSALTRIDLAQLLAVQAFRTNPDALSRRALFRAATAAGNLVRFVHFDSEVTDVAGSGDGTTTVVGLADGRVFRQRLTDPSPLHLFTLPGPVQSVAVNEDGAIAAASTGTDATVLTSEGQLLQVGALVEHEELGPVALSPTGRTLAVNSGDTGRSQTILIIDVTARAVRQVAPALAGGQQGAELLTLPGDDELAALSVYGAWERRTITGRLVLDSGVVGFGAHSIARDLSADGSSFTDTNGASPIGVLRTVSPTDIYSPSAVAEIPQVSVPTAIALDRVGGRLALADSGAVYVAEVRPGASTSPTTLTGLGRVNANGLAFLGDGQVLVAASGRSVSVWDLGQQDRLTHRINVPIAAGCGACGPPRIVTSPTGDVAAVIDEGGRHVDVLGLTGAASTRRRTDLSGAGLAGPAVWSPGGVLDVPIVPAGRVSAAAAPTDLGSGVRGLPQAVLPIAAGTTAGGRETVVVNRSGGVLLRDAATGAYRTWPVLDGPSIIDAAVDPPGGHVAIARRAGGAIGALEIVGLPKGDLLASLPAEPEITGFAFGAGSLLVQRATGALETWASDGSRLMRSLPGDPSYVFHPQISPAGTILARGRTNSTVDLLDPQSGALFVSLPAPSDSNLKTSFAFTPRGDKIVTATESGDRTPGVVTWRDASDEALVATACRTAGRDLTLEEWQTVVGVDPPADLHCR